jgi:hypothetical protein
MITQQQDGAVSNLVKETVSSSVNSAIMKALKTINFQKIVTDLVETHVASGYLPANKVDFSAYSFRDFMSTGIEDKSKSLQLRVLNDTVVVENNFVAGDIKISNSLEAGKQLRANVLDIVGSALFSGDTLMLGRLTTQDENEFKGPAKFLSGIDVEFRDGQIPHSAINFSGFAIPQAQIQPGKIENFESTGIQDHSTGTQLTINNSQVNVSQTLQAEKLESQRLTVSGTGDFINVDTQSITAESLVVNESQVNNLNVLGNVTVAQDLDVKGNINLPESIKDDLVQYMSNRVKLESIIPEGGSLTIGKRVVLQEQSLGNTVIDSNLRKVGTLRELVVSGETSLADTVYFSPLGRIGVNTIEPTMPLDVWDEGVQVTVGKSKAHTGWIGTGRGHDLEIGVNRDPKITITPESTIIKNPVLNDRTYTEGPDIPGINGSSGDIHWNTNPEIGKSVGWICLGGTRWASFGEIK